VLYCDPNRLRVRVGQRLPRTYRRRGRHFRHGKCAAALRAVTAARLLLKLPVAVNNLADASDMCGSHSAFVAAAVTVIQSEDAELLRSVIEGRVQLHTAAAIVKKRAALMKAYRQASPADLVALARTVGVATVFDNVVAPALS
jgi:hypothetical protein